MRSIIEIQQKYVIPAQDAACVTNYRQISFLVFKMGDMFKSGFLRQVFPGMRKLSSIHIKAVRFYPEPNHEIMHYNPSNPFACRIEFASSFKQIIGPHRKWSTNNT